MNMYMIAKKIFVEDSLGADIADTQE
jgi:hypothetical protein